MRSLFAFIRKDLLEQLRSGRILFLGILFVLFGVMNPAIAKLTPWLMRLMADSLAESGLSVAVTTVTALDSWGQFFKNFSTGLIVFVLLESSILTKEYGSGTLVLSLTKGLERYKVVISKSFVLAGFWTVGYWICFWITYGYNAYYWDNAIAQHLALSGICCWVYGLWVTSLVILFSAIARGNTGVLLGTGGVALGVYLLGLLPKCSEYLPGQLTAGAALVYGLAEPGAYTTALIVTVAVSIVCFALSIPIFDRKQL